MKYGIKTIDDFNFKDKITICRLDLNSPYDRNEDKLKDTTRIEASIPTIKELSDKGAKLIILTHQGGDLEYHNFISTEMHSNVLSDLLNKKVSFIDDVCGPAARDAIINQKDGQILLLDNVRYMSEEMTLFETKLKLTPEQQANTIVVRKLAPLGDIYICDAFAAAHRDQPTLVGFEQLLPSAMGRLFEKEYEVLSRIMALPKHPTIFLLGGSKIEDAFDMISKVLTDKIADKILTAGLLAQVCLIALNIDIGEASKEIIINKKLDRFLDIAKDLLSKYRKKIIIPIDFAYSDNGNRKELKINNISPKIVISDIGSDTIELYKREISNAETIFTNGPAGIFENPETETGTKELLTHIARSNKFSVIGGGDSISAINKYKLNKGFTYICTGGGAMVRFLSGEELPVVKALKQAASRF